MRTPGLWSATATERAATDSRIPLVKPLSLLLMIAIKRIMNARPDSARRRRYTAVSVYSAWG